MDRFSERWLDKRNNGTQSFKELVPSWPVSPTSHVDVSKPRKCLLKRQNEFFLEKVPTTKTAANTQKRQTRWGKGRSFVSQEPSFVAGQSEKIELNLPEPFSQVSTANVANFWVQSSAGNRQRSSQHTTVREREITKRPNSETTRTRQFWLRSPFWVHLSLWGSWPECSYLYFGVVVFLLLCKSVSVNLYCRGNGTKAWAH